MQRVSLTVASKCPKTSSDLVSKSMRAAGTRAADHGEARSSVCPSVHLAAQLAAACLRITQRHPELCLLESKTFVKPTGF